MLLAHNYRQMEKLHLALSVGFRSLSVSPRPISALQLVVSQNLR